MRTNSAFMGLMSNLAFRGGVTEAEKGSLG